MYTYKDQHGPGEVERFKPKTKHEAHVVGSVYLRPDIDYAHQESAGESWERGSVSEGITAEGDKEDKVGKVWRVV